MISISELRNMLPRPDRCQICGCPIDENDSELDHIVPQKIGGDLNDPKNYRYVCRKCNVTKSDKFDFLFEYMYLLKHPEHGYDLEDGKCIDYFLRKLTSEELNLLKNRLDDSDKMDNQPMTYGYSMFFTAPRESEKDKLLTAINELSTAYQSYDYSQECSRKINGNTFVYQKDFPIGQYEEILAEYGHEVRDEIYSVYVDDEGRLVVY